MISILHIPFLGTKGGDENKASNLDFVLGFDRNRINSTSVNRMTLSPGMKHST